tara:strand:+ start:325 stop:1248 length:924 start_codon:yes stop_codon:yes gene_type:complete
MTQTPILIMTYRRYENTKILLSLLKKFRQKNIYIFNDGIKNKFHKEEHKKTRNLIKNYKKKNVNIKLLLPKKNLTQKRNLPYALDWVFKNNDTAIILEDDCMPSRDFFKFCNVLLKKFSNDQRIAQISGVNLLNHRGFRRRNNDSYFFSKFTSSWGWATWKNRWSEFYDEDILDWPKVKNENWLKDIFKNDKSFKFWYKYLERRFNLIDDDWDKPWSFINFINNRLSIYPSKNLIKNVGEDKFAIHKNPKKWNNVNFQKIKFPLKHPKIIVQDTIADDFITNEGYSNPPISYRIKNKIFRQINKLKN